MATTGIEIHAIESEITRSIRRTIGKLLSLKLEGTKLGQLVISVDGEERRETLYEAHFVPCEPGDHELEVTWAYAAGLTVGPSRRKLKVHVPEGHVAMVEYTPGDQPDNWFSKIAYVGSRPL
jgi:hypothetical protein